MDYKKLAADLRSGCEENCADCEYAGDSELECTIAQLAATAITALLARAEAVEKEVARLCESLDFARTKDAEIVRLGRALSEAEDRAEKAEKCIEEVNTAILLKSKTDALNAIKRWRGQKEE